MEPHIIRSNAAGGEAWFEEGCFVTELRNTPLDPGLSIARIRVAARTTTWWHRLDVDERYLIAQGTGVMEMDGVPPAGVSPGDVVVVPAVCAQRIRNETEDDLIFYCLCTPRFTPDVYHDEAERNSR